MSHAIIIEIPTKDELKTKVSNFWKKYKKPIIVGSVGAASLATLAVVKGLTDPDIDLEALEPGTTLLDEDGNEYLILEEGGIVDAELVEDDDNVEETETA